jgi:hypothetical protein
MLFAEGLINPYKAIINPYIVISGEVSVQIGLTGKSGDGEEDRGQGENPCVSIARVI